MTPPASSAPASASATADEPAGTDMAAIDDASADDPSAGDTGAALVWPPPDEDLDDWHVIPWRRPDADGAPAATPLTNGALTNAVLTNGALANGGLTIGALTNGAATHGLATDGVAGTGVLTTGAITNGPATHGGAADGAAMNGGAPAVAAMTGAAEATAEAAAKKPLPAWLANHRATRTGTGSMDPAGLTGTSGSTTGTAPWLMTPSSSGSAVRAVSPSSLEDTARFSDTTTAIAAMRRSAAPTGTAPTLNLAPAAQPVVPRPVAAFPSERRRTAQPSPSPWTSIARRSAVVVLALLAIGQAAYIGARLFLTPAPASASILTVDSNPEGAEVFINGERRGLTPFKVELPAGTHALELRKDGRTRSIPVVLAAGIQASQYVELGSAAAPAHAPSGPSAAAAPTTPPASVDAATPPAAATPPIPSRGWVTIESSLNLRVLRNGEMLGSSEEGRLALPAGRQELELMNDAVGYRATVTVQVPPGREVTHAVELPQSLLNVSATPSARVWVDGREVGSTPIAQLALPVGQHEVRFEHPEYGERRMTVLVRVGATTQATVDFTR